jgi:hypothetical protein
LISAYGGVALLTKEKEEEQENDQGRDPKPPEKLHQGDADYDTDDRTSNPKKSVRLLIGHALRLNLWGFRNRFGRFRGSRLQENPDNSHRKPKKAPSAVVTGLGDDAKQAHYAQEAGKNE